MPKSELFFFDSYGIERMKHFIISDDKIIVGKILKGIEMIDQKDKKLTLCKLKFSMSAYKKLKEKRNQKLSESAQNLFNLIRSFGKNRQLTNFVNVLMFEDPIQMAKAVTCGPFQIYFCKTFFSRRKQQNSKLQEDDKQRHRGIA